MNRFYFFVCGLLLLAILAGCGTTKPVIEVKTVHVPVKVYCKVEIPAEPTLPFDTQATRGMGLYKKTQLLAAQDRILKGYNKELKGALLGCKAPENYDDILVGERK